MGFYNQKYEKLRLKNFIETFNAIKEIKIFGRENSFIDSMSNFNKNFLQLQEKRNF